MGILKWLGLDECKKDPVELTDENFREEVGQSELPVLIDVWSPGCQPCQALAPTIMRLACKYDGKIKVTQLNAAVHPKTSSRLGVRGTPTVLFLDRGNVVDRVVGIRSQHYYEDIIETDLLKVSPEAAGQGGT